MIGTSQITETTVIYDNVTVYALWNGGAPTAAWDESSSSVARIGYSVPESIYDWTVDNYTENDYSKYSYTATYSFALPTKISEVTISVPSQATINSSYWPTAPILYARKYYTATAFVYVDDVLCGSVNVSHFVNSGANYTCTFGNPVIGQSVKIVFSRNTYWFKGGQYFTAQDLNLYACSYWVWVNDITIQ